MATLHVHLDESGDLEFSPKDTCSRYYVFAATWTYDPAPLARDLTALKFDLLKGGELVRDSFHAAEDLQPHRDQVVETMMEYSSWKYAAIVIEKRCVNPSIRDPLDFYPKFAAMVLRFVFKGNLVRGTPRVLVYTDSLPFHKHKRAAEAAIKRAANADLGGIPFSALHHARASNPWLQVADYCAWAIRRKWEIGDSQDLRPDSAAPCESGAQYHRHRRRDYILLSLFRGLGVG